MNDGHLSMALSKDLPYNKILRHYVEEFMEKGHISSLTSKWKIKQPTCPSDDFHDLSVQKLAFLFSVFIGGVTFSIIVMLYELTYEKKSNHFVPYHVKCQLQSEIQQLKEAIEFKIENCDNPENVLQDVHAFKMKVLT